MKLKQPSMYLLAILTFSFMGPYLLKYFAYFLFGLLSFSYWFVGSGQPFVVSILLVDIFFLVLMFIFKYKIY